jgi:lipid A 4'-phosphatase
MQKIALYWSIIILALVFHFIPEIDLWASSQFYHYGFYLNNNPIVRFVYESVKFICAIWVLALLFSAYKEYNKHRKFQLKHYLPQLYLALVFAIGPGLLVHNVIKEIYDRPRPHQTTQFGGHEHFTVAFKIHPNFSESNRFHSFVSGHSSVGFMFFALAFLFTDKRRGYCQLLGLSAGLGIGLVRIMMGGHFLSDVIFAGVLVYLTADVLAYLMHINRRYNLTHI